MFPEYLSYIISITVNTQLALKNGIRNWCVKPKPMCLIKKSFVFKFNKHSGD